MTLFKDNAVGQCAAYRNIRDLESNSSLRDFSESLWSRFEVYAEPGFRDALSRDFHQRFWEMYLCCGLLNAGLSPVQKPVKGPDFKIQEQSRVVWVEAIVPRAGEGDDAVPANNDGKLQPVPSDKIILRLRSGIEDKSRKFHRYIEKKIVSTDDCVVIAVNGSLIPHSIMETYPPRILSALLPLGERVITFNVNSNETDGHGFRYRGHITKQSGAKVQTTVFTSEEYVHISAILYCNSDAGNHPDEQESIGCDFTLIHNPYARNPLPRGLLPSGQEFIVENDRVVCIENGNNRRRSTAS